VVRIFVSARGKFRDLLLPYQRVFPSSRRGHRVQALNHLRSLQVNPFVDCVESLNSSRSSGSSRTFYSHDPGSQCTLFVHSALFPHRLFRENSCTLVSSLFLIVSLEGRLFQLFATLLFFRPCRAPWANHDSSTAPFSSDPVLQQNHLP